MWRGFLLAIALCISACTPYAYYQTDRLGKEVVPGVTNPIKPGDHLVKSPKRCFTFQASFLPSKPQWWVSEKSVAKIESTDQWCVTHQFGNYLVLQSEAFNDRQCRKSDPRLFNILNNCPRNIDYGLWFESTANKPAGWIHIRHERITNVVGPAEQQGNWPMLHEL